MKRTASVASHQEIEDEGDLHKLEFMPLGSGREVGRSCHIMEFMGKTIMFDCGIHPGRKSITALPFFDSIDKEIDLVLITHFHLDHIASLPYLTEHSPYKVKQIYMTRPTKSIALMLLSDYVRVGRSTDQEVLYDEKDVVRCLDKCRVIDFHQELEIDGINITCYNAGHVLGACMFVVEISGVRMLYTGDYSRENDRHLMGAEIPRIHPDVLVVESTFGVQKLETRASREERFTTAVHNIVKRGGRCLLPVFSLGRAQELCLILEEYWDAHPELQSIPIFHVSRLAAKSLGVYRAFTNYMNSNVRNKVHNPWFFNHIQSYNSANFDELGPAVVLASPGMLQNGPSRQLFEAWCSDRRNGVIIAGYSVDGTLAHHILNTSEKTVVALNGRVLPLNCEVKLVSFAAHSDLTGTLSFIQAVKPKHVILVHGEEAQMRRLKDKLTNVFHNEEETKDIDFFNPPNTTKVTFQFQQDRVVRVIGRLADDGPIPKGRRVQGILVRRNFDEQLLHPQDVPNFTQLTTTVINQRLHVPFHSTFARLESCIAQLFEPQVVENFDDANLTKTDAEVAKRLVIHDAVTVTHMKHRALLEWSASPTNDMLADSIVALMMQADGGIPAVRDSHCCSLKAVEHTIDDSIKPIPTELLKKEVPVKQETQNEMDVVKVKKEQIDTKLDFESTQGKVMAVLVNQLQDRFGENLVKVNQELCSIFLFDAVEAKYPVVQVGMVSGEVSGTQEETTKIVEKLLSWSKRAVEPIAKLPIR